MPMPGHRAIRMLRRGLLTPMYSGEVAEKLPTPKPRTARPAVMRATLEVVTSCIMTPTMMVMVPIKKTPLRPKTSFRGAATRDPINSPRLIMEVMTDSVAGEISYSPFLFRCPKCRTNTSLASVSFLLALSLMEEEQRGSEAPYLPQ